MGVRTSETWAALEAISARVKAATYAVSREMAEEVERWAKVTTPVASVLYEHWDGRVDIAGELLASYRMIGPYTAGSDRAVTRYGPTAVYAMQREVGGEIVPVHARELSWLTPGGGARFMPRVEQEGTHYFQAAVELAGLRARDVAVGVWREAIGT